MEIILFVLILIGFVLLIAGASVSRGSRRGSNGRGGSNNSYIYSGGSSNSDYSSNSGGEARWQLRW